MRPLNLHRFSGPLPFVTMLLVCGNVQPASGGSMFAVTQQDRSVNGWVWIGGCAQEVQNVVAPDDGLFDESVSLDPVCTQGDSTADASQHSELLGDAFIARGEGHLYGATTQSNVIHGSARSRFDVSFDLTETWEFSLAGFIAAARSSTNPGGGHFAISSVLLSGPSGTVFSRTLQPGLNQSLSDVVDAVGTLPPGGYGLFVNANTYMDQSFNNNWVQSDVSFDITLQIRKPGDVTGDGAVGAADVLAVINAWGSCDKPCPPVCPADIAPVGGDCSVGVPELLKVINHWGM